jgi:hypothetical protein
MSPKWMDAIKLFTDNVETGVLTNDIKLIQDSLEEFMGEKLAGMSVKEIEKVPDNKKDVSETVEKDDDDFTMPAGTQETARRHTAKKEILDLSDRGNKFEDDGSIEAEDTSGLIDDKSIKPVTRVRRAAKSDVAIECSVCGKEELIHPSHVRDFYRCTACCRN